MRNLEILKYFGDDAVSFNEEVLCSDVIPMAGHAVYLRNKDGEVYYAGCQRDSDCAKHTGSILTVKKDGSYAYCPVLKMYLSPIEVTCITLGAVSCGSCKSRNFSEVEIQNVSQIIERKTEIMRYFNRMNKKEA